MIKLLFLTLLTVGLTFPADAKEQKSSQTKIPQHLSEGGYKIRVDGTVYDLEGKVIESDAEQYRVNIDLLDSHGRNVDSTKAYLADGFFSHLSPNQFRVSAYTGTTHVHGDAFADIFQNGEMRTTDYYFIYQPGPIGLLAGFGSQLNESSTDFGFATIDSNYKATHRKLGVTWDLAPWYQSASYLARMHLMLFGGAMFSEHTATIEDSEFEFEGSTKATGAFGGLETRWPLMNLWIGAKAYWTYQKVEIPEVNLKTKSMQQHILFGASYAF